eukprot:m.139743 g.139743  ORF g.139743 m.139743 type:complete len:56 (-) comp14810_c0_seq2:222-389(-)
MADQQPTAKVLVGVTGSVAAVKLPLLVKLLKEKIVSNVSQAHNKTCQVGEKLLNC